MFLINVILSVIIMGLIGWQASLHAFPFRSWANGNGPRTAWDWINLIFIVYNLYAIISTYISLGILTPIGIIYAILMIIAVLVGYHWMELHDFSQQARAYGLKSAIDQWLRSHRK